MRHTSTLLIRLNQKIHQDEIDKNLWSATNLFIIAEKL